MASPAPAHVRRRLRRLWRLVPAAGLAMAMLLPGGASAAPPVTLYAWSGGMAPFQPLHGVRLLANGRGQILEVTPDNRGTGAVTVVGAFTPTAAQRAAIGARAAALPPPTSVGVPRAVEGAYALAVAEVNGKTRALVAVNVADPRLTALFAAIDAALPADRQLAEERSVPGRRANDDPCAGTPATEISRTKTLQQAAAEGLVSLSAKGGFTGDIVAVDLDGKPASGPVTMTVHMEFVDPHPFDQTSLQALAQAAQSRIGTLTASNGTTMNVSFDLRTRLPSDPATPCYHQITINDTPGFRSFVDSVTTPNDGAGSGTFGAADRDLGTGFLIAHEGLHLAGLPDQYTDVFRVRGRSDVVVPSTIGANDTAGLNAWVRQIGRDPARGVLVARPRPGHQSDIMATGKRGSHLLQSDIDALVAQAGVHLHAAPGDLLANKSGDQQNLGVGAPLDMFAPPGGHAHRNGLFAYCIDLTRHIPMPGSGFDALGPAGALPGSNMPQLQAVLEVIARRQAAGVLPPDGAQEAVWAVTDGTGLFDISAESQAILTDAGVAGRLEGTPHFDDPNAGSPATAAVGPAAVIPSPAGPPPAAPALSPRIDLARLLPARIRAGRRTSVQLTLSIGVTGGPLQVVLRRAGGGNRIVKSFPAVTVAAGDTFPSLALPRLAKGGYRLVVTVGSSRVSLPLTVR